MRRAGALSILTVLSLMTAGCGGAKAVTTADFELVEELNGVTMTDSVTLEAEDDALVGMTEVFVYDMTGTDEDAQDEIAALYDRLVSDYQTVEGVICNGSVSGEVYTISLDIELESDTVDALSGLGLLSVSGDDGGDISYEMTKERMLENGYTLLDETVIE